MTTKVERETAGQPAGAGPDRRDAVVGERVLHALGVPPRFLRVQARWLWGDFFRVNVFAGESVACAVVVNSHFVRADAQGRIVSAEPALAKPE
jgi:hypothetical protein